MHNGWSFDLAELGKAQIDSSGFLTAPVKISKTGVFDYGIHKKVKLPDELFHPDTLKSFDGMPIVEDHPRENGQYIFVDNANFKQYIKGIVSDPKPNDDGIHVDAMVKIFDKDLSLKVITKQKDEVSVGYGRIDESQNGEFDGQPFDIIQRNIRGNHLAVVDAGRAGESVKIEVDSKGTEIENKKQENTMAIKYVKYDTEKKEVIDLDKSFTFHNSKGNDIQVDSDISSELTILRNETKTIPDLKAKIEKLEKAAPEVDADLKKSNDKLTADVAALNSALEISKNDSVKLKADYDSKINDGIKDRIDLEKNAKLFDVDCKDKNTVSIKKEIINISHNVDASDFDDNKIDAFYSASLAMKRDDSLNPDNEIQDKKTTKKYGKDLDSEINKIEDERTANMDKLLNPDED